MNAPQVIRKTHQRVVSIAKAVLKTEGELKDAREKLKNAREKLKDKHAELAHGPSMESALKEAHTAEKMVMAIRTPSHAHICPAARIVPGISLWTCRALVHRLSA